MLDYQGWPNVITRDLIRGRQEGQSLKRRCDDGSRGWSDVLWRWRQRPPAAGCRQPLEAGEVKEKDSPRGPPERNGALPTPHLSPWDWFQASELQNCKILNLCCLKPLSYGHFLPKQRKIKLFNLLLQIVRWKHTTLLSLQLSHLTFSTHFSMYLFTKKVQCKVKENVKLKARE